MKIKIFQDSGFDGITGLEKIINYWIENEMDGIIKDTQTSLCQVADFPQGEQFQHMVVCVWYE